MFGKNKLNREELQRRNDTLEQIAKVAADNSAMLEANYAEIEESQRQMASNMKQVQENVHSTAQLAEQNIKNEANLIYEIGEAFTRMSSTDREYGRLTDQLREQADEYLALVEQNKHFTTPSKVLSEGINSMRAQNEVYIASLEKIQEAGKQVGVRSLNAAIEAGRMGESGKQFVAAAEEVRSYAVGFEAAVAVVQEQVKEEQARVEQLQEQVRYLVGLLKDNNVTTARLLKRTHNVIKALEDPALHPYAGEIAEWKEQVIGIRNTQEEILKLQERNKIQLEDITSEVKTQKKAALEISDELIPMLQHIKEYMRMKEESEK